MGVKIYITRSTITAFCTIWLLIFPLPASQSGDNPHGRSIPFTCNTCHSTDSWKVSEPIKNFNHNETGFPLTGKHKQQNCRDCHNSLIFSHIGHACADCHTDVHQGEMGIDCERCHTSASWENRQEALDIHMSVGFPLTGVHAVTDCDACHSGQQFAGSSRDCRTCHTEDFQASRDPDHQKAGFSMECLDCHQPIALRWSGAIYQHTATFPLSNGHADLDCNDCHTDRYAGTSLECYSCHQQDYLSTTDPNHQIFGFPNSCETCHSTVSWTRVEFDHLAESGFELRGTHSTIQCSDCHVNNQISGLPQDCFGCHAGDYNATVDPSHSSGNFPHDCLQCHSEITWTPTTFDHNQTALPLTGAHMVVDCGDCHTNGNYTSLATDCYSCHEADFTSVTDPNHVSNNFNHDCNLCHSVNAWIPVTFDHNQTAFPITGAHTAVDCGECHTNGNYTSLAADCYSCHESDFTSVTDPNHVSNNFDHDCNQCHSVNAWIPATFDHNQTAFPLTGAHMAVDCGECHTNGNYTSLAADCYSCHESDFTSVTDPNHVSNNFNHDCSECHSTTAWIPATFDHNQTAFPLTGAHVSAACADCHATGYTGTSTDCYVCHETEYNGVIDPNHQTAGFPHDCLQCHNTTAFEPSSFNHDSQYFPIYSGTHQGEWSSCSECHINSADFNQFSCLICHEHSNQTEMLSKHHEVSGYSYTSSACYSCHPRGVTDDK